MDATDTKESLVELIVDNMKNIKSQLDEIGGQIDQTQTVVSRAQQRNSDIASELKIIQDNIDSVPREDIRSKYDEALDARFRMTTMRSQLEKFEATRDTLQKQQALLTQLLSGIQGVSALGTGDMDGGDGSESNQKSVNIVRIVQAQEDERQRLARQMHDGPAQSLTNFILQAEICQRLFDRNPERAAEELENLKTVASVTFQKVRDFIFDLRPMMLDDLGVMPTVRRYVDSFKEKTDMTTQLEVLGEERRIENHREVLLFRGIQELMAHSRDHANATELNIRLDMSTDDIKVMVKDNGESFDVTPIMTEAGESSNARVRELITLKEKFELVGGSMTVISEEGEGTEVQLGLPENG